MMEQRSESETRCCAPAVESVAEVLDAQSLADDVRALSAVANETRYGALRLAAAADGELCACDFVEPLGVSQSAVSQALTRLHADGLLTRRKEGRWRYYDVTPPAERLLDALDASRGDR